LPKLTHKKENRNVPRGIPSSTEHLTGEMSVCTTTSWWRNQSFTKAEWSLRTSHAVWEAWFRNVLNFCRTHCTLRCCKLDESRKDSLVYAVHIDATTKEV